MRVYLVRHGDAGDYSSDPATERSRALTLQGRKAAEQVAMAMGKMGEVPAVIVASPFARAQQTADIMGRVLGAPVGLDDALQPHLPIERWLLRQARMGLRRLMVVGHHDNMVPGLEALGEKPFDKPKKAEARRLKLDRLDGDWSEIWRLIPGAEEPDLIEN